jgi:hypothetical protein
VHLEGDHVDVVFDRLGIREVRIAWHRVAEAEDDRDEGRISSLEAARSRKMTGAVARLRYVRREAAGGSVSFRPVWRLKEGRKVVDVDVVR